MRDRVKAEIADAIKTAVSHTCSAVRYRLKDHNVQEVEAFVVSELETQVKVTFRHIPPRYFIVKVSENV